jgi:hypothetical protein
MSMLSNLPDINVWGAAYLRRGIPLMKMFSNLPDTNVWGAAYLRRGIPSMGE